ncbi:ATP-binding protein [Streptomyces sp. NBC_01216]|uniref:ATP-binding protein n=1 Tax=unclassified Streptomyces TaxID=2593676 RepID=UPI002E12720C|nr:ATP-binding protein [Streptomyces sp. NBC_01216]
MRNAIAARSATRRPVLSASVAYTGGDHMIASARDFTADFLASAPAAGHPPVRVESVDLARLVVSELVTNVVRHAPGTCRIALELFTGVLEISVYDGREASPIPRGHNPERVGQHGVEIVVAVCESVTVEPQPSGKRVRARLPL